MRLTIPIMQEIRLSVVSHMKPKNDKDLPPTLPCLANILAQQKIGLLYIFAGFHLVNKYPQICQILRNRHIGYIRLESQ